MAKDKGLSAEEQARAAGRQWAQMGYPIEVRDINRALAAGKPVPERLLHPKRVRPETNENDAAAYEVPPRSGKGSGVAAWREYADVVTDVEPDVLESMDRGDIIELLENRNIIDKEEG